MQDQHPLPKILESSMEVQTKHFGIEKLKLEFSNGEQRIYERMVGRTNGAVMMVPILGDKLVLVREYCAGTNSYELGFPKGKVDRNETWQEAAERELREEIGYKASTYTFLRSVNSAPSFFQATMVLVLAEDLIADVLDTGDEPEPLELVYYPISDVRKLLVAPDFQEARCLAALACVINLKGW